MESSSFQRFDGGVSVNLSDYGFVPAMVVDVSKQGQVDVVWRDSRTLTQAGMVYAALREDGMPLITGATSGCLWHRWAQILAVISGHGGIQAGPAHAADDPNIWSRPVRGRRFQVWARRSLDSRDEELMHYDADALARLLKPQLGLSTFDLCPANVPDMPEQRMI